MVVKWQCKNRVLDLCWLHLNTDKKVTQIRNHTWPSSTSTDLIFSFFIFRVENFTFFQIVIHSFFDISSRETDYLKQATHLHTYIHAHIHTRTHTHIHTHIHTYTYINTYSKTIVGPVINWLRLNWNNTDKLNTISSKQVTNLYNTTIQAGLKICYTSWQNNTRKIKWKIFLTSLYNIYIIGLKHFHEESIYDKVKWCNLWCVVTRAPCILRSYHVWE